MNRVRGSLSTRPQVARPTRLPARERPWRYGPRPPTVAIAPTRERRPPTRERLLVVAVAVVRVLTGQPGISARRLRVAVRLLLGPCTDGDTDAAVNLLGDAVLCDFGPRGAYRFSLDMGRVPSEVLSHLSLADGAT
jgi:hypothetical protein